MNEYDEDDVRVLFLCICDVANALTLSRCFCIV